MADGDGMAVLARHGEQPVPLGADAVRRRIRIQEHVADGAGDTVLPRDRQGNARRRGAAVDEVKVTPGPQLGHEPAHVPWVQRQQATHMVVDATHVGKGRQVRLQGAAEFRVAHVQGHATGTERARRDGFHGQVQHDLLAAGMALPGKAGGMGRVGQEREGHRARQGDGATAVLQAIAQVVDHHGDQRAGKRERRK